MFRHRGKTRTLSHNKKIASLLSFVAGVVNVAGFISVQRLTTNVTGHFAFFVEEIFKLKFANSVIYLFYILCFFFGSFISSLFVEIMTRRNEQYMYTIPVLMESVILVTVALLGSTFILDNPDLVAYTLLFAMGLQNSLVTRISNAIVRTTHLTGLFTDLGIELSQLFFYKEPRQRDKLIATIRLRLRIIAFFFLGGLMGGVFYPYLGLHVLLVPATMLAIGLFYDTIKFKLLSWKRRLGTKENHHS